MRNIVFFCLILNFFCFRLMQLAVSCQHKLNTNIKTNGCELVIHTKQL